MTVRETGEEGREKELGLAEKRATAHRRKAVELQTSA